MLRVGIDCKPLQYGAAGVRTYLSNLLAELARIPEVRVVCFYSAGFAVPHFPAGVESRCVSGPWINNWIWTEWQLPKAVRAYDLESRRSQVASRKSKTENSRFAAEEGATSSAGTHLGARRESEFQRARPSTFDLRPSTSNRIDLFHFPAYTASSRMNCPEVVSIHDVSYAAHPDWYPHAGGKIRQRFYRRSAQCADAVITMSEFSKREITGVYSIDAGRVFSIHLASGLERVTEAERWDRPERTRWYLLHVGDLHARRNLLTALDAFSMVAADRDLDFVFIGRDLGARAEIQEHAKNLGCQDRLHFLQDVPLDQMPHWYRNAAVLVYPSLYEGFGLPLLEAMQCGCPVVASRAASIPEVVGDAAWLIDPMSVREIVEGIRAILTQPETRDLLIQKGLQRVKQFSWKKTAEDTVGVYHEVLRRKDAKTQSRKGSS